MDIRRQPGNNVKHTNARLMSYFLQSQTFAGRKREETNNWHSCPDVKLQQKQQLGMCACAGVDGGCKTTHHYTTYTTATITTSTILF